MSFPQNRYALVTAAAGKFAKADAKCPARVVMDRTKGFGLPAAALSAAYTAPCAGEWWRGGGTLQFCRLPAAAAACGAALHTFHDM